MNVRIPYANMPPPQDQLAQQFPVVHPPTAMGLKKQYSTMTEQD